MLVCVNMVSCLLFMADSLKTSLAFEQLSLICRSGSLLLLIISCLDKGLPAGIQASAAAYEEQNYALQCQIHQPLSLKK